jgi:phosphate transport system permease protein
VEFLTGTRWLPQLGEFGIWPLLNSTLMTSGIAMLVALPLGLGAAVYLSEYASPRKRAVLKPILEMLAGIPTVVFGYFALTFMTPLLRAIFGQDTVQVYNVASAGIVMGIMIVPTISSMSEDALSAMPRSLRELHTGWRDPLGAIFRVLLPAALSGIVAAFILGISRAIGETMIVAVAAGRDEPDVQPVRGRRDHHHTSRAHQHGRLGFGSIDYGNLFAGTGAVRDDAGAEHRGGAIAALPRCTHESAVDKPPSSLHLTRPLSRQWA